jgi:rhodanese-related sulfurtransferase
MGLLDLLGLGGKSETVKEFIAKGAIIIDVRTVGEYSNGHISGSKNIVLDQLSSNIDTVKKLNKPVIVCCQSGMRSAQAASLLKKQGIEVVNGGGWQSLQRKL